MSGRGGSTFGLSMTGTEGTVAGSSASTGENVGKIRGRSEFYPTLVTKPAGVKTAGLATANDKKVALKSNFVVMNELKPFMLYHHHVSFSESIDARDLKFYLYKQHVGTVFKKVDSFDGSSLFALSKYGHPEPLELECKTEGGEVVIMIVKFIRDFPSVDEVAQSQVFGVLIRRALKMGGMKLIGRNYFNMNPEVMKSLPEHRLQVAPGLITGIRQHETQLMMNLFIHSKVMRSETCLDQLKFLRMNGMKDFQDKARLLLVGQVVLTRYNNKTYSIDDVDFSKNPKNAWSEGMEETFEEYYLRKYNMQIKDLGQPMLISRLKTRDRRAGHLMHIHLIPEVCYMTGLTDQQRANFRLMSELANYTCLDPSRRVADSRSYIRTFKENRDVLSLTKSYNLEMGKDLVDVQGRQFAEERVYVDFNCQKPVQARFFDWQNDLRNKKLLLPVSFRRVLVICCKADVPEANEFVKTIVQIAPGMGIDLKATSIRKELAEGTGKGINFCKELQKYVSSAPDMVVTILPRNDTMVYAQIKKLLLCENAINSQVVVKRTLTKNVMSVCTKILLQMNAKAGGALWTVKMPLPGAMFIGYDVCHDTGNRKRSVGAFVASLNGSLTEFYSSTHFHENREELSNHLESDIRLALGAYQQKRGKLPTHIFFYRDGVGEGQLRFVYEHEVAKLRDVIAKKSENIKFSFIVVTKKHHTQFYKPTNVVNSFENPQSGTVIDTVVTDPNAFDFYLISQCVRKGTVSPAMYNVIEDGAKLGAEKYQLLTYKLTHMYYNWSGPIRVPAVCQYAHKLAFLVGQSLHREAHPELSQRLFFL